LGPLVTNFAGRGLFLAATKGVLITMAGGLVT
jgi:hypothetical protein